VWSENVKESPIPEFLKKEFKEKGELPIILPKETTEQTTGKQQSTGQQKSSGQRTTSQSTQTEQQESHKKVKIPTGGVRMMLPEFKGKESNPDNK
ncbi:hypothetical protein H0X06_07205, partial [Candidatus Dependentiae bacterium]|nr:hypothetical protein [Candidatus Dependentiae bacterium]